ncbi:MAG: lasso peptide biosynthesis B2 protein [Sphingopyxis sp.]|nr:lasso peptide biosynthesis B2 protein [Sphingopyxis sp.]
MMDHHLPHHISFTFAGGGAVLLDLERDRYLMLRGAEAAAMRALGSARAGTEDEEAIGRLVARQLIGQGPGPLVEPIAAPVPAVSALELAGPSERASAIEIGRYRLEASLGLRLAGLGQTIARWRNLLAASQVSAVDPDHRYAAAVARGYASARVHLPWRRLCVPDSLALARFLWRRGIPGELYFGVRLDPFAAHAWVQLGDMILSDNVNVVADYTPVFRL